MTKPENPPAFPVVIPDGCGGFQYADNGMTLRDWFAGQVLGQCFRSADEIAQQIELAGGGDKGDLLIKGAVATAYAVADAMLAEREKTHAQD